MLNFCTLFNSFYLSRGLALYESLGKVSSPFHLYIFTFDDKSFEVLNKMELEHATIISLSQFENEALLSVKDSRSTGEYCWTCTPSTIKYCIETYRLDSCTYLDADTYFYSDPKVLIDEMGDRSVMITEHRYTPKYDKSDLNGVYCVQFMVFKSDQKGMKVLNWWADACIDWCYAYKEDNKFGDQKYLDDWMERFDGVHELQNLGGGVAPWNIQQYTFIESENNKIIGREIRSGKEFELVFYHFHNLKFISKNRLDLGGYDTQEEVLTLIYKPYIQHLDQIKQRVNQIDDSFDPHGTSTDVTFSGFKNQMARRLKGNYDIYKLTEFI